MVDSIRQSFPSQYPAILKATEDAAFSMASDPLTGGLLRTLAASKTGGQFLELGTGTGLSTAWILNGMCKNAQLISVDNEEQYLSIAKQYFSGDERLNLVLQDAGIWIQECADKRFDYIFADTWHGKYLLLEETLKLLKSGGLYIIDDMLPQPNWPEGHDKKAIDLIEQLDLREDLFITKLSWATGIIIATKKG